MFSHSNRRLPVLTCLLLTACGGGSGGAGSAGSDTSAAPSPTATSSTPAQTPTQAQVTRLQVAQTHVLPALGLSWTQPGSKVIGLHLTGGRSALVLVDATPADLSGAELEARTGDTVLGRVPLSDNSALPNTEASGERYSSSARVATLPAAWVQPGLEVRVVATNADASAWQAVTVGAETTLRLKTLPFYLFGATASLVSLAQAGSPSQQARDELFAKWPIAHLDISAHPATQVNWPQLVVPPLNGNAAYVMSHAEERLDGFDPISAVYGAINALRVANGEGSLNTQLYGALIQAKTDGSYQGAAGGLGGGHVGAGDVAYAGVFVHEQGHAFGMPHAGESYNAASGYPYPGGSLNGSVWGYDQVRQRFLSTLVPATATSYANCASSTFAGTPRQRDPQGRCIRQDPMQSGSGDQASGDAYTLFSDYNAAVVQKYLEGTASVDAQGVTTWDGGRIHLASTSTTGYQRWHSVTNRWVAVDPTQDANKGLYGVNGSYPASRDVPVYTLLVTRSNAGTAGATQVYPPIGPYSGNLLRTMDPTSTTDRTAIVPNTGTYPWYCHASGCDFTLRVTYANSTIRHVLVQGGFRPWFSPTGTPATTTTDPVNSASFKLFAVNVPADAAIRSVELLSTPQGYQGLPVSPTVLAQRTMP